MSDVNSAIEMRITAARDIIASIDRSSFFATFGVSDEIISLALAHSLAVQECSAAYYTHTPQEPFVREIRAITVLMGEQIMQDDLKYGNEKACGELLARGLISPDVIRHISGVGEWRDYSVIMLENPSYVPYIRAGIWDTEIISHFIENDIDAVLASTAVGVG